jgi:enamine deaminase RidA (YjgF/YER057c/UK114 family)
LTAADLVTGAIVGDKIITDMTCRAQWAALLAFFFVLPCADAQRRKEEREEVTQVLELPPDPAPAVIGSTERMRFLTSPLSSRGLLSRQLEDGFKWLRRTARRAEIIKVRAFVAGSGDLRRVAAVMGEVFADKRQRVPALSVVQVGALPMVGAQVQLQAVAVDREAVNPHGVAFIPGQSAEVGKAVAALNEVLAGNGLKPDGVRQVTCFLNLADNFETVRANLAAAYPKAASTLVQLRRDSYGDFAECEAVAALVAPLPSRVDRKPGQLTAVGPGQVVLTSMQMAFGNSENDLRLALERLGKTLESAGVSYGDTVFASAYVLQGSTRDALKKLWPDFVKRPYTGTVLLFEGLPSLDASMAVDVVTLKH